MNIQTEIEKRLVENFSPTLLEIYNDSHLHQGHAGHDGSGESHFRVVIKSPGLDAVSRVEKHRKIMGVLQDLMKTKIHALQIL
jgi:BolA protein